MSSRQELPIKRKDVNLISHKFILSENCSILSSMFEAKSGIVLRYSRVIFQQLHLSERQINLLKFFPLREQSDNFAVLLGIYHFSEES